MVWFVSILVAVAPPSMKGPIGDVPPAEFEQAYYDELDRQAIAA
jgi:hypothetical protein